VHDVTAPQTNTDVFLTVFDSGSWSAPLDLSPGGSIGDDQWFPFVAVNPVDGEVGVIYNDRSYDATHDTHGVTLSQGPAGGATFTSTQLNTAASFPRQSVFFQAGTAAPGCEACTLFHGDYIGLAYGSDGTANAIWTDMRDLYTPLSEYLQFIYFARR
jgi:hypothetical protein